MTDNLFNGSFERRTQVLDRYNLRKNPFRKDAPSDALDDIFIGRQRELRRAGFVMYDSPRNVLVRGGFGMGKTTFVRKLLSELSGAKKASFLTAYQPLLGSSPLDFQNTALKALAAAMRTHDEQAGRVFQRFQSNERFEHSDIVIGELLGRANQRYTRVVIGIDELDKHPPREINEIVVQSRPILDMECSFILTGTVLDAFRTVDSSAYGAFEAFVNLEPFSREDSKEIILRNLQAARVREALDGGAVAPFEPAVIDRIIRDAAGIPRAINVICFHVLDSAIEREADEGKPVRIGLDFYDQCLSTLGAEIYASSGGQERDLLRSVRAHGGYLDMQDLSPYLADGFLPDVSAPVMEKLTENDMLLKTEMATNVVYTLAASVDRFFSTERVWKQGLEKKWRDAILDGLAADEKGKRLEDFAVELFSRVFKVVHRDRRTATEELDVVLEFSGQDPIWAQAPTILVECKNWLVKVTQKEVSALATKARLNAFDLAFILSVSGFTQDARMQARDHNLADHAERRLVVLVSGADVDGFLSRGNEETADDFLKKLRSGAQLRIL
jgi:hypothetical protein